MRYATRMLRYAKTSARTVEVAIGVQYVGSVLLCAGTDRQVGQGDTMLSAVGELALRRLGARQRGVIDAQVAVGAEVVLQGREVLRGSCAVEDLHARDRAHAQLAVLDERRAAAHPADLSSRINATAPSLVSSSSNVDELGVNVAPTPVRCDT